MAIIQECMWIALFIVTLLNVYNFLYKMRKYRFMPILLTYIGMLGLCVLSIIFFAEALAPGSRLNTNESTWVYYQANIRLCCHIALIGYGGMIIELILSIQMMQQAA